MWSKNQCPQSNVLLRAHHSSIMTSSCKTTSIFGSQFRGNEYTLYVTLSLPRIHTLDGISPRCALASTTSICIGTKPAPLGTLATESKSLRFSASKRRPFGIFPSEWSSYGNDWKGIFNSNRLESEEC